MLLRGRAAVAPLNWTERSDFLVFFCAGTGTPDRRPVSLLFIYCSLPECQAPFRARALRQALAGDAAGRPEFATLKAPVTWAISHAPISRKATHVRKRLHQHRTRIAERSRHRQRTGLCRADFLGAVPQIPARSRSGAPRPGGVERRGLRTPHRPGFPLGRLGRAQDARRRFRPQRRADRQRPDRLSRPRTVSLPCVLPPIRRKPAHDRIQDRRDFHRTAQQVPLRLHPARRAGNRGRPVLQHPGRAPRTVRTLRKPHPAHGQCRAQRRRVLHAAPADPRHGADRRSEDRRDRL